MKRTTFTRRSFVTGGSAMVAGAVASRDWLSLQGADAPAAHQATGTRVGEVTEHSAIVWTRLTAHSTRNNQGIPSSGRVADARKKGPLPSVTVPVEQLEGACPGGTGRVRVRYGTQEDLRDAIVTDWVDVGPATDSIHQFPLTGLRPGTVYHYASETTGPGGQPAHGVWRGRFETAPPSDAPGNLRFCVMTCQGYWDRGHPDGHGIYPAMLALRPRFASLTGDLVYYDSELPRAVTARLARYHWERMFSLPRLIEFNRHVPTYWLKDDHDTLSDDSWPGQKMGEFTFAEGQQIFRQQAPLADGPTYRTFRWGRDLQIWFTDGRDYRSPNKLPDGPEKTIWGREQKDWFKSTVRDSNATWKILISPTPLVGPDRKSKNDNHSNAGFAHEGNEIRGWLREHVPDNFFVVCGDRHWQYHSVHPETGLNEFSVGAASDEHAGGTPGEDKNVHRFHRVKGGFLSVTLERAAGASKILFELRGVNGDVAYAWNRTRSVP